MDELGLVLDRVAVSQTAHVVVPPVSTVIDSSRRRATGRTVASSALVVALVVAFVFVLAGIGLASDSVHPSRQLAGSTAMNR